MTLYRISGLPKIWRLRSLWFPFKDKKAVNFDEETSRNIQETLFSFRVGNITYVAAFNALARKFFDKFKRLTAKSPFIKNYKGQLFTAVKCAQCHKTLFYTKLKNTVIKATEFTANNDGTLIIPDEYDQIDAFSKLMFAIKCATSTCKTINFVYGTV